MKQSMKASGYTYIKNLGNGQHQLKNELGNNEVWFSNKNHASYGIVFKNTHLEFAHSLKQ